MFLLSPLEQFELGILKGIFISFNGFLYDISLTNLSFFLFFILFLIYSLNNIIFYKKEQKVFSNPFQLFIEKVIIFIISLIKENLNLSNLVYFIFLLTIFILIFFSNVIGTFPYSFAITSHLIITFSIAFCVFFGLNFIGYKIHYSNMFSLLLPQGVPYFISSLLVLIEFISYNFRVISLSVRLFANIMAGHTLLAVIYGFNHFLISSCNISFLIILLPLILFPSISIVLLLIGLELGVAIIQSYVFILLCTMYLHDAKYLH